MKPFHIRPAVAADAPAVGRLAREFNQYLRGLGDPTELRFTEQAILRDGFGPDPAFQGLVAESSGQVVGYLLYGRGYDTDSAKRLLHILDLYVREAARRHGVGAALMEAAAEVARARGATELIWSVYEHNAAATAFYERLGARRITDVFFMRLPLH